MNGILRSFLFLLMVCEIYTKSLKYLWWILFAKIVDGFKLSTIFGKSSIIDVWQGHKMAIWFGMGQNIQEWTKQNSWKTAFKKFEGICLSRPYPFNFLKACLARKFTWSILEYLVSYVFCHMKSIVIFQPNSDQRDKCYSILSILSLFFEIENL